MFGFGFLVAAVARGEIQFTGVCVFGFFFVFGRNVRNAETGCDERETRTDFLIGRSNNNDDDDDNNINNSSNKKENASLCVLWNEKMVPFFLGVEKFGEKNCRKSRPSRRRRVQAEPTPKSTLTGLHS